ncbi:cell wall hydrolase [Alkalicaulis satelles]|uniref:Cell wall hydrolase n=2 Tax=Alkalicaulis satelles TaxID=2609175 RepID=A0A5M6ZQE7_9PROT|nr:cell wall hydrolase [Alkalicaulis satelles]
MRRSRIALQSAGAVCAFALVAGAVALAPERAREQDEAAVWRALAAAYLEAGDTHDWDAPQPLVFAAFTIHPDADQGAFVLTRSLDDLRTFDAGHLQSARMNARERQCLAEAVFYEARGESFAGQLAVAEVVLNRVRHRAWPDTICGVVFEGADRVTGCQFSFTCDGSLERAPYGRSWRRAELVADHALMGFARPVTRSATHFHTIAVDPYWNSSLVQTRRIGAHIFYREPNLSERRLLSEREL